MDYLGKEYSDDVNMEALPCHISCLKLINVPCMFDIGCSQADPQTEFLTLSLIDGITHKILKKEFLGKRHQPPPVSEIELYRQQLMAIHTNMQVCASQVKFEKPVKMGGTSPEYDLTIDGRKMFSDKEVEVESLAVSRLMLDDDMTQASIPIMTYLPLKEGQLQNQHLTSVGGKK